jgi:hypothetical protein
MRYKHEIIFSVFSFLNLLTDSQKYNGKRNSHFFIRTLLKFIGNVRKLCNSELDLFSFLHVQNTVLSVLSQILYPSLKNVTLLVNVAILIKNYRSATWCEF